jgi:hypothetical protein
MSKAVRYARSIVVGLSNSPMLSDVEQGSIASTAILLYCLLLLELRVEIPQSSFQVILWGQKLFPINFNRQNFVESPLILCEAGVLITHTRLIRGTATESPSTSYPPLYHPPARYSYKYLLLVVLHLPPVHHCLISLQP